MSFVYFNHWKRSYKQQFYPKVTTSSNCKITKTVNMKMYINIVFKKFIFCTYIYKYFKFSNLNLIIVKASYLL